MESWSVGVVGVLECGSTGVVEWWSIGLRLVGRLRLGESAGVVECWSIGVLE
jgi:hypothetical protein